jgi:hypothetical protein
MIIAICVLAVLLCLSVAFNFLLWWVLKNTYKHFFTTVENLQDGIAYDGEYYPCTLLLSVSRSNSTEITEVYDFSMYDSKNIIGYYVSSDDFEEMECGQYWIPDATVYQPREGIWAWKL